MSAPIGATQHVSQSRANLRSRDIARIKELLGQFNSGFMPTIIFACALFWLCDSNENSARLGYPFTLLKYSTASATSRFVVCVVFLLSGIATAFHGPFVPSLCIYFAFSLAVSAAYYNFEGHSVIAVFAVLAVMFFSLLIGGIHDDSISPTTNQFRPRDNLLSNFVYGACASSILLPLWSGWTDPTFDSKLFLVVISFLASAFFSALPKFLKTIVSCVVTSFGILTDEGAQVVRILHQSAPFSWFGFSEYFWSHFFPCCIIFYGISRCLRDLIPPMFNKVYGAFYATISMALAFAYFSTQSRSINILIAPMPFLTFFCFPLSEMFDGLKAIYYHDEFALNTIKSSDATTRWSQKKII